MGKFCKIVLINLGLLLAGIVSLELVFGGWTDPTNLNRLFLARNIEKHKDVSELYDSENPIITYSRDRYGLRGSFESPEDVDLITVGGSTTDQQNIDDGETWQEIIEGLFSADGVDFVIANAGRDGQSTYGHIENFKWWFPEIPGLSPSYVLFYVGINDFSRRVGFKADFMKLQNPEAGVMASIRENSAIYTAARAIHGTYAAVVIEEHSHRRIPFDEIEWTDRGEQDDYSFMDDLADLYADRLRLLADLTVEMGAVPIFVSQPIRRYRFTPDGIEGITKLKRYFDWEVNGVDYYFMLRKLDSRTELVARERNVLYIDLGAYTDWADEDFYDYVHMTPAGARKAGERMYSELKEFVALGS